jgi:chromosome segregation ATPase
MKFSEYVLPPAVKRGRTPLTKHKTDPLSFYHDEKKKREDLVQLQYVIDNHKEEIEQYNKTIQQREQEKADLNNLIDLCHDQFEMVFDDIKKAKQELRGISKEIQEQKDYLFDLSATIAEKQENELKPIEEYEAQINQKTIEINQLKNDHAALQSQIDSLKEQFALQQNNVFDFEKTYAFKIQKLKDLDNKIQIAESRV